MPIKPNITDPTKILTFANMISLGRAVLAVPIVYTLRDPNLGNITFSLIVIAILSDTLDGWFARQAQEVTHFGKWIDPIADFACILSVSSYLTLVGRFPGWFFMLYLFRYITIALTAIYFLNHSKFILKANWWGKWAAGITCLSLLLHIWPWDALPWTQDLAIYCATFLLTVSWILYIKTFISIYKEIK